LAPIGATILQTTGSTPTILRAALLPLLLLAAVPAAAEPICRAAAVAEAAPGAIRLANGDVFLPDDPSDALWISPGDRCVRL